ARARSRPSSATRGRGSPSAPMPCRQHPMPRWSCDFPWPPTVRDARVPRVPIASLPRLASPRGLCSNPYRTVSPRMPARLFRGGDGMTTERPWLAQYPAGVPAEIDVDEFPSIPAVLEQSIRQFGDRPAFTNMGKSLTYGEVDQLSRQFAAYL